MYITLCDKTSVIKLIAVSYNIYAVEVFCFNTPCL